MEFMNKFCKTGDTKYLKNVPEDLLNRMIDINVSLLWKREGDRHIQKNLMAFFNLNDDGNEKTPNKASERKATQIFTKFCVDVTGARKNDILIGSSAGNKNAVIRILNNDVYPEQKKLDSMRKYPPIWDKFLTKLGSIPFFSTMSKEERNQWLFVNEDSYHTRKIVGTDGVKIDFLQPGNFSEKLTEDNISTLIQGTNWTGEQIENFFSRKPGSKAQKHTLAMIRSFWKISSDYEVTTDFSGTVIPLGNELNITYVLHNITKQHVKQKKKWIRPSGKAGVRSVGIQTDKVPFSTIPWMQKNKKTYNAIFERMVNMTPAAYKSLIQKIIRYRPQYVKFSNKILNIKQPTKFKAVDTLKALIIQLLLMPGSFVPDIQRYVSGMESCFKRVGVSIMEDGYANVDKICTSLTAALLSQRVKSWKPSLTILNTTMDVAVEALNSNKYWDWRNTPGVISFTKTGVDSTKPFVLESSQNIYERCSALLDELRSFQGDLALTRNQKFSEIMEGNVDRPLEMSVTRCVDQHWATGVVYFFPPRVVEQYTNTSSTPFKPLFSAIWDNVSSINTRKMNVVNNSFSKVTKIAQQLYLTSRQNKLVERKVIATKNYIINCPLDIGWIAALVGVIEVGGSPPAIVTLSATDPKLLIPIRRPSRDSADEQLTEDQERMAIRKAKLKLRKGIVLKAAQAPLDMLKQARIKLVNDELIIQTITGQKLDWKRILNTEITYPVHAKLKSKNQLETFKNRLLYIGSGVTNGCDKELTKKLKNTDNTIIRRTLTFITGYSAKIEMHNISRDGGGVVQSVISIDVAVYQFLLKLCELYPGALRPKEGQPGKFIVPSGPLLWHVTSKIKQYLSSKKSGNKQWTVVNDKKNRILWKHQENALQAMINNHNNGNAGTFLWLKVGLGKTLIVLSYVKWLINNKKLPMYVIYTLPESAMNSVIKEIQQFSFDINLLVPLKNIKNKKFPKGVTIIQGCNPEPFKINLIASDGNLRKCEDSLSAIASNALIIFDEVHKNMNDTKRTSVSLSLARLSKEFIAFTGTPVIDSKTYKLVAWLKMISKFEVNTENYLVAANDMITQPANTGVIVERVDHVAKMSKQLRDEYKTLVPASLGGTNANPMYQDWKRATDISYEASNRKMISQTLIYLNEGRRVMVVAKDTTHQNTLEKLFLQAGVDAENLFVLRSNDSIYLTDEEVTKPGMDFKVVIVPIRKAEGYTLIACSVMVTSVYPSNQATRTQIEGRINRIGQKNKNVIYDTIHCGILTNILQNHNSARSLAKALEQIANQ
jgi:superfamily II DNA or RNA helicase